MSGEILFVHIRDTITIMFDHGWWLIYPDDTGRAWKEWRYIRNKKLVCDPPEHVNELWSTIHRRWSSHPKNDSLPIPSKHEANQSQKRWFPDK